MSTKTNKESVIVTNDVKEKINHPSHYNLGNIEVITVIDDWKMNFNLGNCIKYIARAGHKDKTSKLEDLKKAAWYLNHEIELTEAAEE